MPHQPEPTTPSKRSRKRSASEVEAEFDNDNDNDDDYKDDDGAGVSPAKKKPRTPSKTAQKKAEAAQRKQWKADWAKWVAESAWVKDESYRQKKGSSEIHRTDAKTFYRLTTEELDTLPYWEFENENNPAHPGRSYVLGNVKLLVYRKLATLAGLHKAGVGEQELLRRGMRLFDEAQEERRRKNPNTPSKPRTWRIVERKRLDEYGSHRQRRPPGSWESPMWENGEVVGYWLNLQFDPYDQLTEEDLAYIGRSLYRPFGSDEYVET